MTINIFIKKWKEEIDDYILKENKAIELLTNEERKLWILNDENLYKMAQTEGVNI